MVLKFRIFMSKFILATLLFSALMCSSSSVWAMDSSYEDRMESRNSQSKIKQFYRKYLDYLAMRIDFSNHMLEEINKPFDPKDPRSFFSIFNIKCENTLDEDSKQLVPQIRDRVIANHRLLKNIFGQTLYQPLFICKNDFDTLSLIQKMLQENAERLKRGYKEERKTFEKGLKTGLRLQGQDKAVRASDKEVFLDILMIHTREVENMSKEFLSLLKDLSEILPKEEKKDLTKVKQSFMPPEPKKKTTATRLTNKQKKALARKEKENELQADTVSQTSVAVVQKSDPEITVVEPQDNLKESVSFQSVTKEIFGDIVQSDLSVENYHAKLHAYYQEKKKRLKEAESKPEEPSVLLKRLGKDHYSTLSDIYALSQNVSWDAFANMITSPQGFNGKVNFNGGSSAMVEFTHPFDADSTVKFLIHKPHPDPNLYDALMKRVKKKFGVFGLTLEDFESQ